MPLLSSLLLVATAHVIRTEDPLEWLYTCLIPRAAKISISVVAILLIRALMAEAERVRCVRCRIQRFGRKALLITSSSFLFVASCLYRALNIADEGAFLCRGPETVFNAPAAGRLVATIGELALIVQMQAYLHDTARRLAVPRSISACRMNTLIPGVVAESCSWLGVVTGMARFFCAEYVCWVAIAAMWAWDAAELLHKSARRGDGTVHAAILIASLGLATFNLGHELPHFFSAVPLNAGNSTASPARATPFSCTQDAESPIWLSRLPFFLVYFIGASTASTTLAARYHLRGATTAVGQ